MTLGAGFYMISVNHGIYGINKLNGNTPSGDLISLYAPTTAGTYGQILQSTGNSTQGPIWVDKPEGFKLSDLPQFTNRLELDISSASGLNGLVTFPIVESSNFAVD